MSYQRETDQSTGYTTKNTINLRQMARATEPSIITEDQKSVIYGPYDEMMVNLMGDIFTQSQVNAAGTAVSTSPIKRTFATPDRAFASIARQLRVPINSVPLPFGSLMRSGVVYDGTRDNRAVVNTGLSYDSKTVEMHEWPYPANISYTFMIWCRTKNESDVFYEQCCIAGWYQDYIYISADLPRRLGDTLIRVEWAGSDYNEDLEPGADKDRDIRIVFNFVVYGWIPRRTIDRPAVLAAVLNKYAVQASTDFDEDVQEEDIEEEYGSDTLFDER